MPGTCQECKRLAQSRAKVWRLHRTVPYSRHVDADEEQETNGDGDGQDRPHQHVTVNQIVADNMAYWRKVAGLTQEQLGERLGWSNVVVSAAERSAHSNRPRSFTVDDLVNLAIALGVPLAALFLPPTDDGMPADFMFSTGMGDGNMGGLLLLVLADDGSDSDVMDAYRRRLGVAVNGYLDRGLAEQIAKMLRDPTSAEMNADRIARLRLHQAELESTFTAANTAALTAAAQFGEIADVLEKWDAEHGDDQEVTE